MTAKNPLYEAVDIERVAEMCEISSRHLRRILQERHVPRSGHGKVRLIDGVQAVVRHTEETEARKIAEKWTDSGELQEIIVHALIAHWRGLGPKVAKLVAD